MSDLISRQAAIEAVGLNTWAGSRISKLPTVEAIPIEWIKRWLGASRASGLSIDVYTMLHDWEVMEGRK